MAPSSMQTYAVMIVFCLSLLLTVTAADILPSILWNPENPLFERLGNSARNVMLFDKVSVTCPTLGQYPVKRNNFYSKEYLYENLFLVDKTGFDSCNATMGIELLVCNNPTTLRHTTVVFQPTSAGPSDPLFHQGKEYYFINTASGLENSLSNLEGGRCGAGEMKMKIYVCEDNDPKCREGNKVVNGGWSDWSECNDGLQTRQCDSPYQANGGLPCFGNSTRHCSTKASQTKECTHISCTTKVNTVEESTTEPGIPSRDSRAGDKLPENELCMSKGIFTAICLVVLVIGLVFGAVLTLLLCHLQRHKHKTNLELTWAPSGLSRPVSTFSTATETTTVDA